jgi:CelD/BcsL family acetyltransferase involved in cellulose biosynthesis
MLTVRTIESLSQLASVEEAWKQLWERADCPSPFLSPAWVRCCVESYRVERRLALLVVEASSELAAVVPLWVSTKRFRGQRLRTIEHITSPDTPFCDWIVRSELRREVISRVLDLLYTRLHADWDVADLWPWPANSPNSRTMQQLLQEMGRRYLQGPSSRLPLLKLGDGWEAFLKRRSSKYRKTSRNIENRIRRLEGVSVECHRSDERGTALRELVEVSRNSWKGRDGIGLGSSAETLRFFEKLTSTADKQGWLLLWVLKHEDRPIAMEYDLLQGAEVFALRADYDQAYREYSPGAFLQSHIIRECAELGFQEYNTGPGLGEYKLRAADEISETERLTLYNENVRGVAAWAVERFLVPAARQVRESMRR